MRNFKDRFGNQGFAGYGRGYNLSDVPQAAWIKYHDFSGGHYSADSKADVPKNCSPDLLDFEVDRRDRLVVVPGTTEIETIERELHQVALHANLAGNSELLFFDPPFLGARSTGGTAWQNVGLPVSPFPFAWTNFGSTLIFSNRRVGTYARQPGSNAIEFLDEAPAASTFASFAGRVLAGGAVIDGNREPMGIAWSAADSNYRNWRGLGSGAELLIDELAHGDEIVALRTMGLDFMMVGCKRSIWIARRTGLRDRPVDFQPRVPGLGFVNEATVRTTRFGVLGLTDNGIALFDGNGARIISKQINADLLPLDVSKLNEYYGVYNPVMVQYYLFTPAGLFVYDIEKERWYRRSLIARAAVPFATQIAGDRWSDLTGTWAEQTVTWQEFGGGETSDIEMILLGGGEGETELAIEDMASSSNFGVAMSPHWEAPMAEGSFATMILSIQQIILEIQNDTGVTLDIYLPDLDGQYQLALEERVFSSAAFPKSRVLFGHGSSLGAGARLVVKGGKPIISKVELSVLGRGPRIENTQFEPREYLPDFLG